MRVAIVGGLLVVCGALTAQVRHLDVVVRDGHSRIVRDLEPGDFAVQENGAAAAIRSVQAADPKQRHIVSLLFDSLSGEPARLAREAAFELLNASGKANIWFGVFEADQTMRARQSFTPDVKAARKAIERVTGKNVPAGAKDRSGEVEGEAAALTQSILRASKTVAGEMHPRPAALALISLIRGEGQQPGRKAIVYFTQGLPVDPKQEGFRFIVSLANRAGIAIYTVDAAALAISHDEVVRRAAALQTMIRFNGEERAGREGAGAGPPSTIYQQTALSADRLDRRANFNAPVSALSVLSRSTSGFFMESNTGFRTAMRRVVEELTGYYDIAYVPRDEEPDGSFRSTRVEVRRDKAAVQGREGYYATPDLSGRPALPYEVGLLGALERRAGAKEFALRSAVLHFRGADGKQPVVTVAVEVPIKDLQFQQDDAAGVYRARVAVLALVRAADGTVVDRVGGDTPILCPPAMLGDMRQRFVAMQKQIELPPGKYVLETAAQDRIGQHFSTSKAEFTVVPAISGLGLSTVTIARAVMPPSGEEHDAGFHLDDKSVQPALDGRVSQGRSATVYFKVYPDASAAEPVDLAIEVWQGEERAVHSTRKLKPQGNKALAEVLALDLSRVPPGAYELRVVATQAASRAEERAPLMIEGAGDAESKLDLPEDTEIPVEPVKEPKSVPPTAEQQTLLQTARDNALKYSERLPNFICTQATRHMMDSAGRGDWRTIEESSDLLSFYDGQEHYAPLTTRAKTKEGEFPASVSSAGEFGSMLKEVFDPASGARFAWVGREHVRGRAVQVFSYAVEASHSRYRVTYRGSQQRTPVFAAFHGLVAVDPETATVLKLTLSTEPLPADIPVRQISLTIAYDEVGVADQIYLLPIAATIDVRLHKKTVARNEVTFRTYQRFSADSRIIFQTK